MSTEDIEDIELTPPRSVKAENSREATREAIYQASKNLVKTHGFEYLTIRNVCKAANISSGTFYYYFQSKENLMAYYLNEGFERYRAETGFDVTGATTVDALLCYYKAYANYAKENGVGFISSYYTPANKALDTRHQRGLLDQAGLLRLFTVNTLQEGIRKGEISDKCIAVDYSNNCCTMLKGIIFEWALTDGDLDTDATIDAIIGTYLKSICAK